MRRFLIVDDAEAVRLLLADHLSVISPGATIATEATAPAGLQRFLDEEFDLVFLDGVFASGARSVELLRAMLAAKPRARVALMTARPRDHPEVVEALGIGAYAYLAKPVTRAAVESLVGRAEADEWRVGRIP